tara:strand:+ start:160 stop:417 length:258 start_codon:yes stop_codon:yes gene_type:complete
LLSFFVEYLSVGVYFLGGRERKNWKNQRENWKRRAHTARIGERARARARRARDVEKGKNMPDAKKIASFPRAMTRARDITSEPLM